MCLGTVLAMFRCAWPCHDGIAIQAGWLFSKMRFMTSRQEDRIGHCFHYVGSNVEAHSLRTYSEGMCGEFDSLNISR